MCALTEEAADPVDARGPVEASGPGTVVDVDATIGPGPAVDADARVAAVAVGAGGPVVAERRPDRALVDVVLALRAREGRRTEARVLVDPVDAGRAVLAEVADAVVDVLLALVALKACVAQQRERLGLISD